MIGKTLGHHEVLEKIGSGGMGEVYRARDTRLGRQVALKLLSGRALQDREALERFRREARAASALNHPNICTIHDIGEHEGQRFIVMELLEGETLQQKLGAGPLPIDELLQLARQLADALDAAHSSGVFHRDIKPGNLFVTSRGLVKMLDFGLAKPIHPAVDAQRPDDRTVAAAYDPLLTTPGMLVGTIVYMSPEQALGREIDARSDIFSLGAVLYEMATGRQAFSGATPAAIFDAILHQPPAPAVELNPDVPDELGRIIDRAMEKERDRRYPTAAALRSDLDLLARGEPTMASQELPQVAQVSPSIAVLPFVNMSADPDNEYFTDGMAEEVINTLCKIEALQVASRTSSFAFKGKQEDVRQIGRALNVANILEGSVRKAGKRLRITAQLTKVDDGYHLWSERFDRDLEDVFAVQDEIAESIASALRVVLSSREKKAIEKIPTRSMEAYDLYLRGLAHIHHIRDGSLRSAEVIFRQAVEIDPGFALAWVGLAVSCAWIHTWFAPTEELRRTADEASRRALAIDPELAEAHVARGLAASLRNDYALATQEFDTAVRIDPRLFDAYYFRARVCMTQGRFEEAVPLLSRAAEVRPEDYQALSLLATCLRGLGRPAERRAVARRALDAIDRHLRLYPDEVRAVYFASSHWSVLGEREKALEWARRALEMSPDDSGVRYNVACCYLQEDLIEEALDLLEQNVETGWGSQQWIDNDPDLDPLRDHPRFLAMKERLSTRRAEEDAQPGPR
jgi:non-specific serine/threonine protein kinase